MIKYFHTQIHVKYLNKNILAKYHTLLYLLKIIGRKYISEKQKQ